MAVKPDPEYDYVPPLKYKDEQPWRYKKGAQCGECGMKFEHNKAYGYCCANQRCPMMLGPRTALTAD